MLRLAEKINKSRNKSRNKRKLSSMLDNTIIQNNFFNYSLNSNIQDIKFRFLSQM